MHRLWIAVGSIVTIAAIGFATLNVVSVVAHEEVRETATFEAAAISLLDVHTDHGTIEVVGADVDDITLEADISHGLRRTEHRAEVDGDTLVVESGCFQLTFIWCSADYRLVVPTDLAVTASSGNGRITLRDLGGDVDVDSNNGRIELLRLTGGVHAMSDNGRVEGDGLRADTVTATSRNGSVRLTFASAPTTVVVRSRNGSVEVTVPDDDTSYRVETDTDHGSIDAAVRTDPASPRSIVATTRNGSVRVRYPTG